MAKKYSNDKLYEFAENDLIWVKKSSYYQKLLEESLKEKGYDLSKIPDNEKCSDLVHEELWWDLCKVINNLAESVLEEREKKTNFLNELKRELKDAIGKLSSKRFKEYY